MKKELVSIIIPTHNQLQYTKLAINSLFNYTNLIRTPFEIIVVDNASTDGTVPFLQGLEKGKNIKAIYNKENVGYPKANNQAAAIAEGEYILLLNNDVILTEDWLEKLLRCMRSDSQVAMVGPYTSVSTGLQRVTNAPPYTTDKNLQDFARRFNGTEKEVKFTVFFCCLIKRKVWDEIGGLEEVYGRGNYEDEEFCWKVVERGYKQKIANAYVHHFGGKSFGYNQGDPVKWAAYAKLLAHNQKLFLKRIGKYKTISLCMIVSDQEKPETLKRCLDTVAEWVDQICIVFNYKDFSKPWRVKKLMKVVKEYEDCDSVQKLKIVYEKWENSFSEARNKSLKLATGDYCFFQDTDDLLTSPQGLRDLPLKNPDTDAFRCIILSARDDGRTTERIISNRLFKNGKGYKFVNRCHEDCTFSMLENNAKIDNSNLTIQHLGNVKWENIQRKNRRNYKLLMEDLKDSPHSLIYYGLVNCLMLTGGYENHRKAIELIDEAFAKCGLKPEDPLTPKMWILRGLAAMKCFEIGKKEEDKTAMAGAKQSFHKAFDEQKHPEAAVNLAEIYIREKNYDKAIEILEEIYKIKEFKIVNIPFDLEEIEALMLHKLGDCWARKKDMAKAEKYYRECLTVRMDLQVIDQLTQILRKSNRANEAHFLTLRAVNFFPSYFIGFYNAGQFEMANNRPTTARLYWQEAVRINPDHKESRHNLKMILRAMPKTQGRGKWVNIGLYRQRLKKIFGKQ